MDRRRERRVAAFAVAVSMVLVAAKGTAWALTGSVAMLATLVDSLMDVLGSASVLYALETARTPADDDHRYGHTKAEALGALIRAGFVCGSGAFLAIEAIGRLMTPVVPDSTTVGIVVLGISILLAAAVFLAQRRVARSTGSVAIAADSLDYQLDMLVNAAVVVALVVSPMAGMAWVDPAIALVVVCFILANAWRIGRTSIDELMDREIGQNARDAVIRAAFTVDHVDAVHDVRTRLAGGTTFVQVHVELDPDLPLSVTHEVADLVEERVRDHFRHADVLVHVDPLALLVDASGHGRDRVTRGELER